MATNARELNEEIMSIIRDIDPGFGGSLDIQLGELGSLVDENSSHLNDVNVSTTVSKLSKKLSNAGSSEKQKSYPIIDSLQATVAKIADEFLPWSISDALSGMVRLDYAGRTLETLRDILLTGAYNCAGGFDSQALANLANAHSKAGRYDPEIFDFITGQIENKKWNIRGKFVPRALASLANAYAKVGRCDTEIFDFIAEQIVSEAYDTGCKFIPQDLANLVHAYAKVGRRDRDVFGFIDDQITSGKYDTEFEFDRQSLANLVYGLGLVSRPIPQIIVSQISTCHNFELIHLNQFCMGFSLLGEDIPSNVLEAYKKHEDTYNSRGNKSMTPTERTVFQYLKGELDAEVKKNQLFKGFEMDIVLPSLKVDVEIDGPHHMPYPDQRRDNYLRSQGWEIIRIPPSDVLSGNYRASLKSKLQTINV